MEETEEKMAALKRAYADVILNMAKESAARIMASEQRALRFKHDLHRVKEEAVATLVRVKSILDSKVKEAERAAAGQGRRIQELEARLAEAENAAARLRTELSRAEGGGEGSEAAGPPPLVKCRKMEVEGEGKEETLKYTFRRKRKKGSPENVSPEQVKSGGGGGGGASSRDSRRIVQVARQLISLSEKKW